MIYAKRRSSTLLDPGESATVVGSVADPFDRVFSSGSLLASWLSTGSILFVFSELLVLAGRQDRLRRFRSVYPPFSRKE